MFHRLLPIAVVLAFAASASPALAKLHRLTAGQAAQAVENQVENQYQVTSSSATQHFDFDYVTAKCHVLNSRHANCTYVGHVGYLEGLDGSRGWKGTAFVTKYAHGIVPRTTKPHEFF